MSIQEVENSELLKDNQIFIMSASWEERCVGALRKMQTYTPSLVILNVYEGKNEYREKYIREVDDYCAQRNIKLQIVDANKLNPLPNILKIISILKNSELVTNKMSIDITCFTKKHLLQLLQGLDLMYLLQGCQFLYTEPANYNTSDISTISQGIYSIEAINTFNGQNFPSLDTVMLLFMGYEGGRARALWEYIEPNVTIGIIQDPPYRPEWEFRAEAQNQYILSVIPENNLLRAHPLIPESTNQLLKKVISGEQQFYGKSYPISQYNYKIAPLGSKPQVLGIYKYWRKNKDSFTIIYPTPMEYQSKVFFPPSKTWLIDSTQNWNDHYVS